MPAERAAPGRSRWRRYHLLALLPALGMLGGLSWANRVYPLILGLPFLMAWLVGWVVVTAGIMAFILRMDRTEGLAIDRGAGEEAECGAGEGKGSGEGRGERR